MATLYIIFRQKSTSALRDLFVYNTGMIGHLSGTIVHQDLKSVIIDVGGVGYKVFTTSAFLSATKTEASLWTYLAVKDNALDLYGFATKEELDFFELLLSVSGIGPKSALGILSMATLPNLRTAIRTGDTAHLVKVSGIGRKNAEKIVLELKDKIDNLDLTVDISGDTDALLALESLGFSEHEAREALKKVAGDTAGEKVKQALKLLS